MRFATDRETIKIGCEGLARACRQHHSHSSHAIMARANTLKCLPLAACLGMATVAHADALSDIKSRGTLVCGTLGTSEPFSFQDPKTRQVVGYEVDLCKEIADDLGVKLEIKMISVAARIPELVAGLVDVVAAKLGWSD